MMIRSILGIAALFGIAAPGLAAAQTAAPSPTPGPAAQPMPMPSAASPTPGPAAQPMPTPVQPQPYAQPYGYGPPPVAAPRRSPRGRGLTVEVNLGWGRLTTTAPGDLSQEGEGGSGALAVGGWLSERLALTLRASSVTYSTDEYGFAFEEVEARKSFFGVAVQYWIGDSLWAGLGLGGGELEVVAKDGNALGFPLRGRGVSADLRLGFTPIVWKQSSLNVSLEVTPLWHDDVTDTATAVLIGYQYL